MMIQELTLSEIGIPKNGLLIHTLNQFQKICVHR